MAKGPLGTSIVSGSKCMSKSHMPKSQGKMSAAHGVVPAGKTKGLINASGRVGAGSKGFTKGLISKGPTKIS